MSIAKSHDLKVISDAAQSPGAKYKNKFAGTLADIGGFSLNYHKHIHTGEGGFLVTNDDEIAHKMRLIRNHAEVVIETNVKKELINMLGYNFRLGEIECAIGIEQLKKLDKIVKKKKLIAKKLNQELKLIDGLIIPHVEKDRDHVYYVYGLKLDLSQVKVCKEIICKALFRDLNFHQNIKNPFITYVPKNSLWVRFLSSSICKETLIIVKDLSSMRNCKIYLVLGYVHMI